MLDNFSRINCKLINGDMLCNGFAPERCDKSGATDLDESGVIHIICECKQLSFKIHVVLFTFKNKLFLVRF